MASENQVTIVGNLTDDPELRFTSGGQAFVRLSIANNRRWQDRATGEWKEDASFFNAVAWREIAENVARSLNKGSRVILAGRLRQRSWETPTGERRSAVEIQVDEIGPSLRWATAEVSRVPRREGDASSGSGGGAGMQGMPEPIDDNWSEAEPVF